MRTYRPSEASYVRNQHKGMQAFVKLERSLTRQVYHRDFYSAGQAALELVGCTLANPSQETNPNIVFISIDFEGMWDAKGLKELGIARLDAKSLFSSAGNTEIQTLDYILKRNRRQKFVFGEAARAHEGIRPQIIVACFDELRKSSDVEEIILVMYGHGELQILEGLGLPLEELGIAGIADTLKLSQLVLGIGGSMEYLVRALHLPICAKLLH